MTTFGEAITARIASGKITWYDDTGELLFRQDIGNCQSGDTLTIIVPVPADFEVSPE